MKDDGPERDRAGTMVPPAEGLDQLLAGLERAADELPPDCVAPLLGRLETLKTRLWRRALAQVSPTQSEPVAADEQLLTAAEVAGRLAVPKAFVYELARRGELPTLHVGARYVRIPVTALEQWVRRQMDHGTERRPETRRPRTPRRSLRGPGVPVGTLRQARRTADLPARLSARQPVDGPSS
jgi:excisionase family DNA binding protein